MNGQSGAARTGADGGDGSERADATGASDDGRRDAGDDRSDDGGRTAGETVPRDGESTVHRLHPRIRILWALQAALTAAVVGAVTFVAARFLPLPTWTAGVVGLALLLAGGALAVARYRRWHYEVREDSLYLERGVFTRVRTVVPYVRIQHVDASRGPVERLLGLASTVVYTAGSRGADVTVPGLTPDGSEDLQERLKRLAIRAEGEDAV